MQHGNFIKMIKIINIGLEFPAKLFDSLTLETSQLIPTGMHYQMITREYPISVDQEMRPILSPLKTNV